MRTLKAFFLIPLSLPVMALGDELPAASKPTEHFKLSGYVQGRYTHTADASEFGIRRGRLKASWANEWSRYVLQIDATPSGIALKDAEATFIEPWTGQKTSLTLGQTKLPFGFEAPQSSSTREFPERTRVVRALVPGERDRGAKYHGQFGFFLVDLGVFNGNGLSAPKDNDRAKDVVGRFGVDFDWLTGGVSGWWGETLTSDAGYAPRNRVGADLQMKRQLVGLGATEVRAEWLMGHTWAKNGVEQAGDAAMGWYATVVQGLGASTHLAFRYDYFEARNFDGAHSLGIAVTHDLNKALELTGAFEMPFDSDGLRSSDSVAIVQLQAKF